METRIIRARDVIGEVLKIGSVLYNNALHYNSLTKHYQARLGIGFDFDDETRETYHWGLYNHLESDRRLKQAAKNFTAIDEWCKKNIKTSKKITK